MPTSSGQSGHVQRLALGPELRRRSDVLIEKGLTLVALSREEEALAAFNQALALHRSSPRAWYNKGLVLAKMGRYAEALAAFEAALERNHELSFLWLQKGLVLTALGRDEEAVVALERAVALDPQDALAWRYRGAALFRLKRYEEALAAYDHTLQLPNDRTVIWRARGPAQKVDVPAEAASLGIDPVWSLAAGIAPAPSETQPAAPAPRSTAAPTRAPARVLERSPIAAPRPTPSETPAPAETALPSPVLPAPATAAPPATTPAAPPAVVTIPARPRLAPNIVLHGELKDAGFQQTQWLAERNGNFLQLTELVYQVAANCDGAHTLEEIAARVRAATGKNVSAENVKYLLATRLLPAGLIEGVGADGAPGPQPATPPARGRSPLSVTLRFAPFSPRVVNAVAGVFQHAYFPPLLVTLVLLSLAGQVWLYVVMRFNFSTALDQAFANPLILLETFALVILASFAHETGHASALRYGGGHARRIGMGFYMFFPVFYADVSENYRLGRWARIRTDLGGIYFNLLADLPLFAAYFLTHAQVFLLAVAATNIEILYNLLPFGRYDGYWLLADLTGIPDFFALMGPFLRSLPFFHWWHGPRLPALKPWVRGVYAVYTLVAVPALGVFFAITLLSIPRTLPALVVTLAALPGIVGQALGHHDVASAVLSVGDALILLLFFVAIAFSIISLGRTAVRMLARLARMLRARRVAPSAA